MSTVLLLARNIIRSGLVRRELETAGIGVVESATAGRELRGTPEAQTIRVVVVGIDRIDGEWMDAFPAVELVLRAGSGTDNIRLERHDRVHVASFPSLNAESVADYAFGLLLAAGRRIVDADAAVRRGGWGLVSGTDLVGKTLGLIGFGAIGRAMARRASGFDLTVLVHTRTPPTSGEWPGIRFVALDELLEHADFVSLHAPLTERTTGMIGERELARMKPGAVLVNTARGALVDEAALVAALDDGRIAGAAIDAFQSEPPVGSALLELDGVIVSPHTAAFGDDAISKTDRAVLHAIERHLQRTPGEPGAADHRKETIIS